MTLQLELTPEQEARLDRIAQTQGLDKIQYARLILGLELPLENRLSIEQWEAALDEVASDIDPAIPPLLDEAISRAGMYGDRA